MHERVGIFRGFASPPSSRAITLYRRWSRPATAGEASGHGVDTCRAATKYWRAACLQQPQAPRWPKLPIERRISEHVTLEMHPPRSLTWKVLRYYLHQHSCTAVISPTSLAGKADGRSVAGYLDLYNPSHDAIGSMNELHKWLPQSLAQRVC